MIVRRRVGVLALGCAVLSLPAPVQRASGGAGIESPTVEADFHTLATPPMAGEQFELLTLSAPPDAVTGSDVLVAVRGLDAGDPLTVSRNGTDVTAAFEALANGERRGLVGGLDVGPNTLAAASGDASATLIVQNHPTTGPVISGPHQEPFRCETVDSGLGEPLDADCSIATRYQWFYRSAVDQSYHGLADPYAAYPPDVLTTVTSDGRSVPWVVRVETASINRGIARLAVLDDPAARGPDTAFDARHWNGEVTYFFGSSSGVGYRQGTSPVDVVLGSTVGGIVGGFDLAAAEANLVGIPDRVGRGDVIAHNTLTIHGITSNPFVNRETTMMMKEHISEQYGLVARMVGVGLSGGAIQSHNMLNNGPGLLDGAAIGLSFADVVTTAMTVTDCGLLQHYYDTTPLVWTDQQRAAANGHDPLAESRLSSICQSWTEMFFPLIRPTADCVPADQRYDPQTNPEGVRCGLVDSMVNIVGRDPDTGFARRPLDNVGVQYGLEAFNRGVISYEQFVDLNRRIGGLDVDGNFVADRHRMPPDLEAAMYRLGLVVGRGALDEAPILDHGLYVDLLSILNIHESVRPFVVRDRLRVHAGSDATQVIWRGVVLPGDGRPVFEAWLDAIDTSRAGYGADHSRTVIGARPASADDRCAFGLSGGGLELDRGLAGPLGVLHLPVPPTATATLPLRVDVAEDFDSGLGPCSLALPVVRTPRIVAGMPLSDDIIRCQTRPVDAADYPGGLTDAQLAPLRTIFPGGVCDYSQPAAGDVEASMLWASLGGDTPESPHALTWRVARSATLPTHRAGTPEAAPRSTSPSSLPATGGASPLVLAAVLVAAALAIRRSHAAPRP